VLIDRENWPLHRRWVLAVVALAAFASAWYVAERVRTGIWPGGSSLPGSTFGVAGGLLILFEAFLWVRKKVRAWRIGRAQVWMRAHIWLGLLCLPLLVYHSGFRMGGTLSTVLMVLLLVVIASGVWGLVLQQFLPSRLLEDVPAETIYSQIDRVAGQLRAEAGALVLAVCGPAEDEQAQPQEQEADYQASARHLVVGAVRSAGRVQGKVLETRSPAAPVAGSEPLRAAFHKVIEPYLLRGRASALALRQPAQAAMMFKELRTRLAPAAHPAIDTLEGLCDQRRQLDTQRRLHFWLHNWLWVHLPLSAALVVLMFIHAWAALRYW
jgi:hypothetical protein